MIDQRRAQVLSNNKRGSMLLPRFQIVFPKVQTQNNVSSLPDKHKTLDQPATYPVTLSQKLENLQQELINEKQSNVS